MGEASFSKAIDTAQEIYGLFDHHFLDRAMDSWALSYLDDTEIPCLDVSNRYFTPSRDAPGVGSMPFHIGVNPQGILADMMTKSAVYSFVHAEDNQVKYYKSCKELDRGRRYVGCTFCHSFVKIIGITSPRFEECEPQTFRLGNIVEVQLSFVGVPLKEKRCKLLLVLCSIALLDGQFSVVRLHPALKVCLCGL
jgi:hypothetical protein